MEAINSIITGASCFASPDVESFSARNSSAVCQRLTDLLAARGVDVFWHGSATTLESATLGQVFLLLWFSSSSWPRQADRSTLTIPAWYAQGRRRIQPQTRRSSLLASTWPKLSMNRTLRVTLIQVRTSSRASALRPQTLTLVPKYTPEVAHVDMSCIS